MFFPYITGKNFAFRILVEIAASLFFCLSIINKDYRPRNSTLTLAVLAFTFIVGLADLTGLDPYNSFWSNYERMEGYITIIHLVVYFILVKSVLKTRSEWKIFLHMFMLSGFLVSLYAIISPPAIPDPSKMTTHAIAYGQRAYSTIGNPPFLASYLLLVFFVSLLLILNSKKNYQRYIYLIPLVLNIVVIYMTASRGALLSLMVGLTLFSFFCIFGESRLYTKKILKISAVFGISLIFILLIIVSSGDNFDYSERDNTISRFAGMLSDASVLTRINAWKMSLRAIKEKPVLGWGQENFIGIYTVNPIHYVNEQIWLDRAHNIVLEWLVNAGILGLIAYAAIFATAIHVLRKSYINNIIGQKEYIAIVVTFSAYIMQNLFTFDTINTYVIFFTLLAYIENLGYKNDAQNEDTYVVSQKRKAVMPGIIMLIMFLALLAVYFLNYKPIKESQMSYQIAFYGPQKYRNFNDLLKDFNDALSNETFGDTNVREKMLYTSNKIYDLELFKKEGAFEFFMATVKELEKEIENRWYNLEFCTYAINFYKMVAAFEPLFVKKGELLVKRCMAINPEYQWLYFALADIYMIKKDYEKVFIIVKNKISQNKNNEHLLFKLALASILTSRNDIALNTLEKIKKIRSKKYNATTSEIKSVFLFDELYLLAQTYSEVGNYHKALSYYKKVIALLPDDEKISNSSEPEKIQSLPPYIIGNLPNVKAKLHFQIANSYRHLGDNVSAIREAEKASEIDPSNYGEKTRIFINNINNS
jgi:oligosaccharide repeat unit polymerase